MGRQDSNDINLVFQWEKWITQQEQAKKITLSYLLITFVIMGLTWGCVISFENIKNQRTVNDTISIRRFNGNNHLWYYYKNYSGLSGDSFIFLFAENCFVNSEKAPLVCKGLIAEKADWYKEACFANSEKAPLTCKGLIAEKADWYKEACQFWKSTISL